MTKTFASACFDTSPEPTERDLSAIIQLVYERSGIALHQGKRQLVTARLQKRVREGGFATYAAYLAHVEGDASGVAMMRLHEAGYDDVRLLASDISTKALKAARAAVYPMAKVADVPLPLLRTYFEKGLGEQEGLARVKQPLRQLIEFRALNLLDITTLGRQFDFVFCRNVMIYFDKAIQQRVVTTLERHLKPGGYLFIAHSESLNGITHGLEPMIPAVFRKRG
jgi:chemotaxis methyl-accepting protein methylase